MSCGCYTCTIACESRRTAFEKVEDERAEFEETFKTMDYDVTRSTRLKTDDNPLCDYVDLNTAHVWMGWLCAAGVQWCME